MATGTIRTETEILALFADNNIGNISEQDLRDFVCSIYNEVGSVADDFVKVSSDDTTSNYLENKLVAGSNIAVAVLNPGADETVQISATGTVAGTGTDNNIARWNGTSDVQDSAFTIDDNGNLSVNGSGSGYATVASGAPSTSLGYVSSTSTISTTGSGSFASGHATSSGTITSTNSGAVALGFASGASSTVTASGIGSLAVGEAVINADILAGGDGAVAMGSIYGTLSASGTGSMVHGTGSFGGDIYATSSGAFAGGTSNGRIEATAGGSFAHGNAGQGSTIAAAGDGSICFGHTSNSSADITSSNDGSFAGGFASGTGATLEASGAGSLAFGHASGSGSLIATSTGSVVIGTTSGAGVTMESSGNGSFCLGQGPMTASGAASFAIGNGASAEKTGELAHSSGALAATGIVGSSQYSRIVMMRDTADASSTELTIGGLSPTATTRYTISDEHSYDCWIRISARRTTGAEHAEFIRRVLIERTAGTTALVGTVDTIGTDNNTPAWSVSITADDTNDFLNISVTGAAATSIRWVAVVEAIVIENSD
jgi:hypothetical protein